MREECPVLAVIADGVLLGEEHLPADLIVWAGGFTANALAADAGVRVNGRKQIVTDACLRSLSHPNIYAAGDCAAPIEQPGAPMRMSLFTALVSGAQTADNIAAELRGKEPKPLSFAWYGQGIALGPQDAVGFPTYPAGVAWRFVVRGKVGVAIRNFFVAFLVGVLELERRFPGAFY